MGSSLIVIKEVLPEYISIYIKGIVYTKMKMMALIAHHYVIPTP